MLLWGKERKKKDLKLAKKHLPLWYKATLVRWYYLLTARSPGQCVSQDLHLPASLNLTYRIDDIIHHLHTGPCSLVRLLLWNILVTYYWRAVHIFRSKDLIGDEIMSVCGNGWRLLSRAESKVHHGFRKRDKLWERQVFLDQNISFWERCFNFSNYVMLISRNPQAELLYE